MRITQIERLPIEYNFIFQHQVSQKLKNWTYGL